MNNQLRAELTAANMLGYNARRNGFPDSPVFIPSTGDDCQYVACLSQYGREFSLNDADDLMATVIALGERHGLSIVWYSDQEGQRGWYFSEECGALIYPTYKQAVAAAVMAVVEDEGI